MPATNAWLRSRFLSSPGWRRIRSRQTSRVSAGSSASGPCSAPPSPGIGPVDAGRAEVDLAHLGRVAVADLGPRVVGRQPGGAARPGGRVGRAAGARPEAEDDRRLGRQLVARATPAGSGRSASGCTAISSRSRSISRNLPRRRIDSTRWPTRPSSSAGVPRTASGPGAVRGQRPAGRRGRRGGRRRPRSDRAIRARRGDCSRQKACARLSRPQGARTAEERHRAHSTHEGADRGVRSPRTTSIVSDTA